MAQVRIALGQFNPTVGDLEGNAEQIVRIAHAAARASADLVAVGEMALTGYPIEDLALRSSFQRASKRALDDLASTLADQGLGELPVVVGYLDSTGSALDQLGRPRGGAQNAAAVLLAGRQVAGYAKHHLPNYGVFDEFRYFVPGDGTCRIRVNGVDIAIAICEDLWQDGGPVERVADLDPGLLLVINGSPYERNKDDIRFELCSRRARELNCAIGYVNIIGGQDELVFDGDSMVVSAAGELVARSPQFVDDLLVVDLDLPQAVAAEGTPLSLLNAGPGPNSITLISSEPRTARQPDHGPARIASPLSDEAEVYLALQMGLADYVRKNGFRSVTLGMSGGIDSALVGALACDAIGAENVYGVSMPSAYSSEHSQSDAAASAEGTGMHLRTVPIAPMVDAYHAQLELTGLAEENLQARVRGTTLMAISNQEGHLVLATGNKSEVSVGYSTIYGDAVGGFAPIKDAPKTLVWELARWRNAQAQERGEPLPIPVNSITKPPSAELRPGQLDSHSLPDYDELDRILAAYVGHDMGASDLVEAGFDPDLVEKILRLTDLAEYKRRQYPPGTKITYKAFGRDRRVPITNRWREPHQG